jgi:hypothetical protein
VKVNPGDTMQLTNTKEFSEVTLAPNQVFLGINTESSSSGPGPQTFNDQFPNSSIKYKVTGAPE